MIYKLSEEHDKQKAIDRFKTLLEQGAVVELKKKVKRTLNQNSYLHLILTGFALEYGSSLEYAKQEIFKKIVNPSIFEFEVEVVSGRKIKEYRSSADLDTAELTKAIERFRNYSASNGIYLPAPNELEILQQIEIEASKNNYV